VQVVLCQRVVHPQLKVFLRRQDVVVVDRIGAGPVPYLTTLTGKTTSALLFEYSGR